MRDFQVFVTDDRYAVASLYMVQAATEERARALATDILRQSEHHTGVELWDADKLVLSLGVPRKPVRGEASGPSTAAS